jgi:DNA-binding transcriptional ArsR family regulator
MSKSIVNQKVKNPAQLDLVFRALASYERRGIVRLLSLVGPARAIYVLAQMPMTLPGALKHLRILENCGLVRSEKRGRTTTCELDPAVLRMAHEWVSGRLTTCEREVRRAGITLRFSCFLTTS